MARESGELEPDDVEEIERRMNIHRLQAEARELAGGEMSVYEADDFPTPVREQFWEHVVAYERAGYTTLRHKAEEAGVAMPPAEELDDEALREKLWQVIEFLAGRRVFHSSAVHRSDRELYVYLREDGMREEIKDLPPHPNALMGLDVLGSGSEEDMALTMRYYADDEWRRRWAEDFPDFEMPPREEPPFDRDRHLPQATFPEHEMGEGGEFSFEFEEWDDEDEEDGPPQEPRSSSTSRPARRSSEVRS